MVVKETFRLGDFLVDPLSGEVTDRKGEVHHLGLRAMKVLTVLLERPGELLSRDELLAIGWEGEDVHVEVVAHTIGVLRQCFGDDAHTHRYIETLPRRGYRLVAEIHSVTKDAEDKSDSFWVELGRRNVTRAATMYAITAFVLLQIFDATSEALPLPANTQRLLLAVLVAGFPIVMLLAWFFDVSRRGVFLERQTQRVRAVGHHFELGLLILTVLVATSIVYVVIWAPTGSVIPIRVAVLPFSNLTGDPTNDYLGDSIAEELIDGLEEFSELNVITHNASFYFKKSQVGFKVIVEQLDADFVVEGNVLDRQGNRVSVNVKLVDGNTGELRWKKSYQLELEEFINTKHEIARMIVNSLSLVLVPDLSAEPLIPPISAVAYDYYLQGLDYLRRYATRNDQVISRDMFEHALEIEPNFHAALSGLCQIQLEMYQQSRDSGDYQIALSNCTRLINVVGVSVDALVALGTLNRLTNNIDQASSLFDQALELKAEHAPALHGLSRCYDTRNKPILAEQYILRAIDAERTYWKWYVSYAGQLFRQGRYEEAKVQSLKVTALNPDNAIGWGNLGAVYYATDDWEAAEIAWVKAFALDATLQGYANLGTVTYYQHKFDEAQSWLEQGVEQFPDNYRLLGKLAAVYRSQPGNVALARETFERALEQSQRALIINPDDTLVLAYVGLYAANLGRAEMARESINRALSLAVDNPEFHYFKALVGYLDSTATDWQEDLDHAIELGYSARLAESDPIFTVD